MIRILLLLAIVVSCSKGPSTPEGLIEMYVSDVTTKSMTKSYFEKYTDGDLWESISSLSEEEFSKFTTLKKVKNAKVQIANKDCSANNECRLTYVVKYSISGDDKSNFNSEVKKVADVRQVDGNWKIFKVSNIKTFVDSNTPLEVLEE